MRHELTVKELIALLMEHYAPEAPVRFIHSREEWSVMGVHTHEPSKAVLFGWAD